VNPGSDPKGSGVGTALGMLGSPPRFASVGVEESVTTDLA
jgi:hypothetical protein